MSLIPVQLLGSGGTAYVRAEEVATIEPLTVYAYQSCSRVTLRNGRIYDSSESAELLAQRVAAAQQGQGGGRIEA